MKQKPDLLVLVAIWEFIAALMALIGITAISLFAFPTVGFMWGRAATGAIFGLSVAILLLVCYIGVCVSGGIGLLAGKEWGRILSIVQAAFSLLSIPFGTVIGILAIIYLTKNEVRDYFLGTSH